MCYTKSGRMMKCDLFSSSFPYRYMTSLTLIATHCEVRSVGRCRVILRYGCREFSLCLWGNFGVWVHDDLFRFLADLCRFHGGEVIKEYPLWLRNIRVSKKVRETGVFLTFYPLLSWKCLAMSDKSPVFSMLINKLRLPRATLRNPLFKMRKIS